MLKENERVFRRIAGRGDWLAVLSECPVSMDDLGATARRHGLTFATGNDQDFRRPGLKVFNPFKELPPV